MEYRVPTMSVSGKAAPVGKTGDAIPDLEAGGYRGVNSIRRSSM